MAASAQRKLGVDLFRGVSALYIVGFWHLGNYTTAFDPGSAFSLRFTWVVLASFTLTSGYFLGKKQIEPTLQGVRGFVKNRFLRIYPLYLLALGLFIPFKLASYPVALKAAFGLSMFFPPPPPTLWFITMLLFFYALAPLISWGIQQGKARSIWGVYVFISALLLGLNLHYHNLDVRVLMYFPAFLLGFLLAAEGGNYLSTRALLLFLLLGGVISFSVHVSSMGQRRLLATLLVSAGAYLLFLLFKDRVHPPAAFSWPIGALSTASYCMYLIHRPLYAGLIHVYFPKSHSGQLAYLLFVCLPLIILASYLLQRGYDKLVGMLSPRPSSSARHEQTAT